MSERERIPLHEAARYFADLKNDGWGARPAHEKRAARALDAYVAEEQAADQAAQQGAQAHEQSTMEGRARELAQAKELLAKAEQDAEQAQAERQQVEAAVSNANQQATEAQAAATEEAQSHAALRIEYDRMRERVFQVLSGSEPPPNPQQDPAPKPGPKDKREALKQAAASNLAGAAIGGTLGALGARRAGGKLGERQQKLEELERAESTYKTRKARQRQRQLVAQSELAKEHPRRARIAATAKGIAGGVAASTLLRGVYERGREIQELRRLASLKPAGS